MKAFLLLWIFSGLPGATTGTHIGRRTVPHIGVDGPFSSAKACDQAAHKVHGEVIQKIGVSAQISLTCVRMVGFKNWVYVDMAHGRK